MLDTVGWLFILFALFVLSFGIVYLTQYLAMRRQQKCVHEFFYSRMCTTCGYRERTEGE